MIPQTEEVEGARKSDRRSKTKAVGKINDPGGEKALRERAVVVRKSGRPWLHSIMGKRSGSSFE